jgi:DNA-binding CsgD family transcriptional regulator
MISLGITYKEIAKKLGISSSTVTSHMNNIYKKLGLRNKAELSCEIAKLNQFSGKVKFMPQ